MKPLSYIYIMLLLLCTLTATAQDVITFTNGDEVKATVTEVNDLKIKYKLYSSTDSAIHSAKTSNVFMIKYANGTKQIFGNTLPSQDVNTLADKEIAKARAQNDYTKYSKLYKYKRTVAIVLTSIGAPALVAGVPLAVVGRINDLKTQRTGIGNRKAMDMFNAGGLLTVAGFTLTLVGGIHFGLANKYKTKRDAAAAQLSFHPTTQYIQPVGSIGGSYSGLAMRLSF